MASYDDTATVSGSVVGFNNGADSVPIKNWIVTLPASLDGYSEVNGTQTGRNLFDKSAVIDNTWIVVNDTTTESAVGYRTSDYIPVKANTRYYVSTKASNRTAYYDKNKNGIAYFSFSGGQSFNCLYDGYIRITIKNDIDLDTFIVNEGNTAITYEPYNGTTYTASLGRTIYGGQADIVMGEGEDGYIKYVIDGVNNYAINVSGTNFNIMPYGLFIDGTINKWVCDTLTASSTNFGYNSSQGFIFIRQAGWSSLTGVTDVESFNAYCQNNPITLILPKTTATAFTFTPITPTPETAKGSNTFWSDQGNTELTYYKDGYGTTSVTIHKETPDGEPIEETRKLHRIIYEGQVDVINGTGLIYRGESGTQYDPPEQISFTPIEVSTDEGENTLYADQGDSAITYRKAVD